MDVSKSVCVPIKNVKSSFYMYKLFILFLSSKLFSVNIKYEMQNFSEEFTRLWKNKKNNAFIILEMEVVPLMI